MEAAIDLADAYLQIELDEESKKLVVTHKGHVCYNSQGHNTAAEKDFRYTCLPQMIISDNSPNLCQKNLDSFVCSPRGIQHNTIAPYHPRSNGEAERLVEIFKQSIDKANPKTASQLQDAVIDFLARYQSTPPTAHNLNY